MARGQRPCAAARSTGCRAARPTPRRGSPSPKLLTDGVDGRLRQVEAERHHGVFAEQGLVQRGVDRQEARDETRVIGLGGVAEGAPHRRRNRQRGAFGLVGQAVQNLEHDDEHRHLRHDRQTRGHRVDLVLLIELHHLFVELGLVVAVLVLELAHLGGQALHLEHALGALQRQRCGDRHDHRSDHGQHHHITAGQAIEP